MRLRGKDRGNRAITVLELHVNRGVVDTHGPLQRRRCSHLFEANKTRQGCESVRHSGPVRDVAIRDAVRFNQLCWVCRRGGYNSSRRFSMRSRTSLRYYSCLNCRRNQRKRQCGRGNRGAPTRLIWVSHRNSFHRCKQIDFQLSDQKPFMRNCINLRSPQITYSCFLILQVTGLQMSIFTPHHRPLPGNKLPFGTSKHSPPPDKCSHLASESKLHL